MSPKYASKPLFLKSFPTFDILLRNLLKIPTWKILTPFWSRAAIKSILFYAESFTPCFMFDITIRYLFVVSTISRYFDIINKSVNFNVHFSIITIHKLYWYEQNIWICSAKLTVNIKQIDKSRHNDASNDTMNNYSI